MPDLRATEEDLGEDWLYKLTKMIEGLQEAGIIDADHDPYAMALFWSSLTAGLAAHHLANPNINPKPALELARAYAQPTGACQRRPDRRTPNR